MASTPVHVIAPSQGWVPVRLGEIWEYRELLGLFVWRELKVRYKQTVLGVAWAIAQPLLTMAVFTVLFGRLARVPSDGLPYPLFAFCALLPWQLFAFALTESSGSVVRNDRLVTKVYFPRLIMPLAAVVVGLVDFAVSFGVLVVLMIWYGVMPGAAVWTLPVWVAVAALSALAIGLWLSALNVRYRDVRYTVPFLAQLWLLATPVAYPASIVPETWRPLVALNPMTGVVEGFRWALLGAPPPGMTALISLAVVAVLLVGGLFYFRRTERGFADVI